MGASAPVSDAAVHSPPPWALPLAPPQPFLPHLHAYISVCGPHVGSGFSRNWLLRAGTACVRLTRRWPCLRQLDGDDSSDPLLHRLARAPFLQLFAFALLVWSPQVPPSPSSLSSLVLSLPLLLAWVRGTSPIRSLRNSVGCIASSHGWCQSMSCMYPVPSSVLLCSSPLRVGWARPLTRSDP
jgi:hypothetical protein